MKKRQFLLSALALATTATFTATFSPSAAAADAPKVIRIGVATVGVGGKPVFGGSTTALVHVKGLLESEFKADGIKVEWNFFKGAGPAVNEALANKLLDFAWQGDLPAIIGRAGGLKTKILLADGTRGTAYLAVPSDSTATSIEDLKGKRVALFKGTNAQLLVAKILEPRGLGEKDFRSINMDGATTTAAISTKDIDGAWFGFDVFSLVDRGIAKIVYSTVGKSPTLSRQTHFLVTEEFDKQYPEVVQRVVNTLVKEAAWASDDANREQVLQTWSKSGVPYKSYKQDYEGLPLKVRLSPLLDEYFRTHYRSSVDLSRKFKLVRGDVDVKAWFDDRHLQQALKQFKLENQWPEYDARGDLKKQP